MRDRFSTDVTVKCYLIRILHFVIDSYFEKPATQKQLQNDAIYRILEQFSRQKTNQLKIAFMLFLRSKYESIKIIRQSFNN